MTPLFLLSLACGGHHGPNEAVSTQRAIRILAFNDVYRIEGFPESSQGGLPRLRTLRLELEAQDPNLLVLGAGDFMSPSLLSNTYKGEQMVDVLNGLDGAPEKFDSRLILGFGNHEFDSSSCKGGAALTQRLAESDFNWLASNIQFQACEAVPALQGSNLLDTQLLDLNGVKVGVFSLLLPLDSPVSFVAEVKDTTETARAKSAALRAQGAELVIAVTHQRMASDQELLAALGAAGPDLIVGGHEHVAQSAEVDGRWVVKADADARSAVVWTVTLDRKGISSVTWEPRQLDSSITPDSNLQAQVDSWLSRHQTEFCASRELVPGCLDIPLGHTQTDLVGEELAIRQYETSLGNWITDEMRQAFINDEAQIAFINGGALRLNQDLPAGTTITRRHFETLLPFPSKLVLIELDASTLEAAVNHAVSDWTGNGHWMQVSGFGFTFDPSAGKVSSLSLLSEAGRGPLPPGEKVRAVTLEYLAQGNDGFTMLNPSMIVAEGEDLKDLLMARVQKAEPDGIAPKVSGRICNTQQQSCP